MAPGPPARAPGSSSRDSQRRVVIENAAPETVEAFLRLLYLDTLPPKTDQGALRVLADQYLVHGLVERCGKAQSLSPNDSGAVTAALITLYPLRDREGLAHFRGQDREAPRAQRKFS